MITVVFLTVYTQMTQAVADMAEARRLIAALARHFSLAEVYADGCLVDSIPLGRTR